MVASPPLVSALSGHKARVQSGRLAIDGILTCYLIAFMLYEYAITFDQEVDMFWKEVFAKKRISGATALFLVNRYLVSLLRLFNLLGFTPMTDKKYVRPFYVRPRCIDHMLRCVLVAKVALGFTLLQYVPWAGKHALLSLYTAFIDLDAYLQRLPVYERMR